MLALARRIKMKISQKFPDLEITNSIKKVKI